MTLEEKVIQAFEERYHEKPTFLVRAPGRVNLIGEHTDYNDGFVLPIAINRTVWIALRPTNSPSMTITSLDYDETKSFSLENLQKENSSWVEYLKGVAYEMKILHPSLQGWEGVFSGDVPKGAGLSSSAAVEIATARAFSVVNDIAWKAKDMALLGQRAENKWVGVNCGIMDQMISAAAEENKALLIDCRSLDLQPVSLPPNTQIVILDTGTRRGLVDSEYNERRQQCEEAAKFFGVKALRDVSLELFQQKEQELDPLTRKRARHVITEDERVLDAVEAMKQNDAPMLGRLMNESHISLRDDFEVTNDALNMMVALAKKQKGCFGARMTGAGFGGCAVALVNEKAVDNFVHDVIEQYTQKAIKTPSAYVTPAALGASVITNF